MSDAYNKRTRALQTRVDPETYELAQAWAKREGITLAEALRCFVEWAIDDLELKVRRT